MKSILRSVYSSGGGKLYLNRAERQEGVSGGHNTVRRVEYCGKSFYLKRMKPDEVKRASDSYRILEELGFEVPKVYSDVRRGYLAVEDFGEDYGNLKRSVERGIIHGDDIDEEEILEAAGYKFLVSDFDAYPRNMAVDVSDGDNIVPFDYECAGISGVEDFVNATVSLERFLNKDIDVDDVYEVAREIADGLNPEQIRDMYVEEVGLNPESAEGYTRYLREYTDKL